MGNIDFFEGNNCSQDKLGSVSYLKAAYDLLGGGGPIPNDEARSCRLYNLTPGSIKLFNSPGGNLDDDWTEIKVLQSVSVFDVNSFNSPVETPQVQVIPYGAKLDGKVSRIEVFPA
ncbi:MAG: hypothetical protein ACJ76N_01020 [Thermoanaerobaculia bacterium]